MEEDTAPAAASTRAGKDPPADFLCPISRELMADPVRLSSGAAFDRASITEWFAHGNDTCPLTRQKVDPAAVNADPVLAAEIAGWATATGERLPVVLLPQQSAGKRIMALMGSLAAPAANTCDLLEVLQSLQRLAWETEGNKMTIADAGGVEALLALLEHHHDLVRWHAAEVLSMLALVDCLRDTIVKLCVQRLGSSEHVAKRRRRWRRGAKRKNKCLDALLATLAGGDDDARVQAAWALWVLSLDPTLRETMLCERTLLALVSMLSSRAPSASRFAATRLLRSLVLADAQRKLSGCGAIAALVRTVATGEAPAAMAACSALCNVDVAAEPGLLALVVGLDALPALRRLLECASEPHWQGWAGRFVRNLVATANAEALVAGAGLLPPLVAMLSSPDNQCALTAVSALYKAVEAGAGIKATVARMDVVPALAAATRRSDYPLRFMAARTLAELALPAALPTFRAPAVAEALEALLQEECEHCQYFAAVALLNVSRDGDAFPLGIVSCPTLRGLIRLLSSASATHRCAAAGLLRQLSRLEGNRQYLVKYGAIHALLEVMTTDDGRCPVEAAGALQALARANSYYRSEVLNACQQDANKAAQVPYLLHHALIRSAL